MSDDEKIAPTAHYTAYVWHRLALPHAELFATSLGRAMFWGFRLTGEGIVPRVLPGVPSMTQYLELRHRGLEAAMVDEDPDLIVELGAGLSRRGVTWAADRGVRYVEVDLPAVCALKQRLIASRASAELRERLSGRLSHFAADVSAEDFDLERLVRRAERPVIVAEGLLGYFAMPDRERLVRTVARALGGKGAFVCEMRTESTDGSTAAAAAIMKACIRLVTKGRGTRQGFGSHDEVRLFLLAAGFASAEPIDPRVPHLAGLRSPTRVWRAA